MVISHDLMQWGKCADLAGLQIEAIIEALKLKTPVIPNNDPGEVPMMSNREMASLTYHTQSHTQTSGL